MITDPASPPKADRAARPSRRKSEIGNPKSAMGLGAPRQRPGCLPEGYDDNSFLDVEQFRKWRMPDKTLRQVRSMLAIIPGVDKRNRKCVRIHVGAYKAGLFGHGPNARR